MKHIKRFQQVPEAPTRPGDKKAPRRFDVAELYQGPAGDAGTAEAPEADSALGVIDEKLRQAYYWIVNHAVINPYYDIEFLDEAPEAMAFGDSKTPLVLPTDQSYSSYVLLPLLNLPLRRRCLLVGGPGRGKTAIATL
ncbi:MAG: ATPase, partial [Desulfovibrio sp.]